MKNHKLLSAMGALVIGLGVSSAASAATITGSSFTATGTIAVSGPSSFGATVNCNVVFNGSVDAGGATASINSVSVSGSSLCAQANITGLPWTLTPTTSSDGGNTWAGTVSGVGFTIAGIPPIVPASNCAGPTTINAQWINSSTTLRITSAQALAGGCTVRSLNVTAPGISVN
ncbi:alkane oxidation protein activator PraB [Pseudomonas sp. NCHU5208]|uniref:alkane oxidation protein activator PraB n=1 Tax=unclassified Pseudomonas TaxID=196821 RepID=UPI003F99ABEA